MVFRLNSTRFLLVDVYPGTLESYSMSVSILAVRLKNVNYIEKTPAEIAVYTKLVIGKRLKLKIMRRSPSSVVIKSDTFIT